MLVLSRKTHEQIQIGDNITITVVRVEGKRVRLGIDAPGNMRIMRTEIIDQRPQRSVNQGLSASTPWSTTGAVGSTLPKPHPDSPAGHSDKERTSESDPFRRPAPDVSLTSRIRPHERLGPAMLRGLMASR